MIPALLLHPWLIDGCDGCDGCDGSVGSVGSVGGCDGCDVVCVEEVECYKSPLINKR